MKQEKVTRSVIITFFLILVIILGWGYIRMEQELILTGHMPEEGGWQPGVIKVQAGEAFNLKLTSSDVMHGFAIGKIDVPAVDVYPGKFTTISVTIDEPGTYTYYCTRWCGPNHWRMRGTIEVEGEEYQVAEEVSQPLYLQLGIDIDASHEVDEFPLSQPTALVGTSFYRLLPAQYLEPGYYFAHSPSETFTSLRNESTLSNFADEKIWELVAGLYWYHSSAEDLALAEQLYIDNCAVCHGLNGDGNGVFAGAEEHLEIPTDFTDPAVMLGASPALLQGKIIRGGMGTGMPYWGTIFTEEETWALVEYLWSFQFQYPYEDD